MQITKINQFTPLQNFANNKKQNKKKRTKSDYAKYDNQT